MAAYLDKCATSQNTEVVTYNSEKGVIRALYEIKYECKSVYFSVICVYINVLIYRNIRSIIIYICLLDETLDSYSHYSVELV